MNFVSLREYFYKLANRCYLLILLPLAVFIYLYYLLIERRIGPLVQDEFLVLTIVTTLIISCLVNLTTVHWLAWRRLGKISTISGLGEKLDRFVEIVMLRFGAYCASAMIMALGLLLTASEWFAGFFILILLWAALQWPRPRRACYDLKLKGDEYQMVRYKKDRL